MKNKEMVFSQMFFIETLAECRAKELFTKEFFETCTDSWYGDELNRFMYYTKIGKESRKPTEEEIDAYMSFLCNFKDEYYDNLFTIKNALGYYGAIINRLREVVDIIDEAKNKSKAFECTDDIYNHLKSIGNYFVNKYNNNLNKE